MQIQPIQYVIMTIVFSLLLMACGADDFCAGDKVLVDGLCMTICAEGYSRSASGDCQADDNQTDDTFDLESYFSVVGIPCYSPEECSEGEQCIAVSADAEHGYCVTTCQIMLCDDGYCVDHAEAGREPDGRCWSNSQPECTSIGEACDTGGICTLLSDGSFCLDACDPKPNACPNPGELCFPYTDDTGGYGGFCYNARLFE